MKKETLLVLLDTLFDDKVEQLKKDLIPIKGERGFKGKPGQPFDFESHKEDIFSQIKSHIENIQEEYKLKFSDLSEEDIKLLKIKPEEITNSINIVIDDRVKEFKLQFSDLTEEEKNSLRVRGSRGQKGKAGKDFIFEEHREDIKKLLPKVEDLKLKFGDLTEEDKDSLKVVGPKGFRGKTGEIGKGFIFEDNKKEIEELLPKVKDLKLKFSDLTECEVKDLKLKFDDLTDEDKNSLKVRGSRGQRGKSIKGEDGRSWLLAKDKAANFGDMFLDTNTFDICRFEEDWKVIGNIKGINGVKGSPGLTGLSGVKGFDGFNGSDGKDSPKIIDIELKKIGKTKIYFIFYFDDGKEIETERINLPEAINALSINSMGSSGDSGLVSNIDCDTSVYVGSWVYLDDSNVAYNGLADAWSTSNIVGVVVSKPTENKCNIKGTGITTEMFSGLTPGLEYVLSMDNAGEMVSILDGPAKNSTGVLYKLGTAFGTKRLEISRGIRIGRT